MAPFTFVEANAADRLGPYVCPEKLAIGKVRAARKTRKPLRVRISDCVRCGGEHEVQILVGWRKANSPADLEKHVGGSWAEVTSEPPVAPPEPKPRATSKPKLEVAKAAILDRLQGGSEVRARELQAASGVGERTCWRAIADLPEVERLGGGPNTRYRLRRDDATAE